MKKLYFRCRILLMTFALGLASVFMLNGSLQTSDGISVNLPQTASNSPLIVFPVEKRNVPFAGSRFAAVKCNRALMSKEEIEK